MQMTCSAATPPTVAEVNAFDDIYRGIPVYVPTASVSLYQLAYGWREFTNYMGVGTYTVTAESANATMGTVSGGGSYAEGAVATLTAIANAGYRFERWHDGNTDNPRMVTVTGDATYTAYFEADETEGIDDAGEEPHVEVYASEGRIHIVGERPAEVAVYDAMGRRVAAMATGTSTPMPAGVYLVKVGTLPARKVVVVR